MVIMGYLDTTSRVRQVQGKTLDNTFPIPLKHAPQSANSGKKYWPPRDSGEFLWRDFSPLKRLWNKCNGWNSTGVLFVFPISEQ